MSDKTNACGLLFDTAHDVQRRVKRGWCSESQDAPPTMCKLEESESEYVEDNEGCLQLWLLAKRDGVIIIIIISSSSSSSRSIVRLSLSTMTNPNQGAVRLIRCSEGLIKISQTWRRNLLSPMKRRYSTLQENDWIPPRHNVVHQTLLQKIQALADKGLTLLSAVKRISRKRTPNSEDLFDTQSLIRTLL